MPRINQILLDSITDGPGINTVVVFQGCKANCPGCHNPHTHDCNGGKLVSIEDILKERTALTTGFTFSGGEPMLQLNVVKELAVAVHKLDLTVTLYTGYTVERFVEEFPDYPNYIDFVKVGPYVESLRSSKIPYYGSSNQELYQVDRLTKTLNIWRDNGNLKTE